MAAEDLLLAKQQRLRGRITQFMECSCGCWPFVKEMLEDARREYTRSNKLGLSPGDRAWLCGALHVVETLQTRPEEALRRGLMIAQNIQPTDAGDQQRPPRGATGLVG